MPTPTAKFKTNSLRMQRIMRFESNFYLFDSAIIPKFINQRNDSNNWDESKIYRIKFNLQLIELFFLLSQRPHRHMHGVYSKVTQSSLFISNGNTFAGWLLSSLLRLLFLTNKRI